MDWGQFEAETHALGDTITVNPHVIVGVVRGGIIPARILSTLLGVPRMYCITTKTTKHGIVITNRILESLSDRSILLVEDMLETGRTMAAVAEYLKKKQAKVYTAALYVRPTGGFKPDFFLAETANPVTFPWE